MAVYTIELGRLIDTGYDIGMDTYPVPSFVTDPAAWRKQLNQKIINHYLFMEIGCLPPDRFKHFLNMTMAEIMPVKNKLFEALNEEWKFYTGGNITEIINDGHTADRTLNKSGTDSTSSISNSTTNANNYTLNVGSDTPGQMLNIESDIANNTYASRATKDKSNGNTNTIANNNDTTTYGSKDTEKNQYNGNRNRTVSGLYGKSYAELFKEYSEALRNIDVEIIDALSSCFMGIF